MNIAFYGNGSAGNHGCEAIIRGSVRVLGDNHYLTLSENVEEDLRYHLNQYVTLAPAVDNPSVSMDFLVAYLKMRLTGNYCDMDGLRYKSSIQEASKKVDVAFSVGGDNYCYGNPELYAYMNRQWRKKGIPTILWGCSIEPEVVRRTGIQKDLLAYTTITARESITEQALLEIGANVERMPDPAFFMDVEPIKLDSRFKHDVVGINISPMIMANEAKEGIVFKNYCKLIDYLLKNTDYYIALIPHVVWAQSDDRIPMLEILNQFDQDNRIFIIEDCPAPQLKYVISKCRLFVGARTHASIAAYSSCVPTLVVGYSVKAQGIARDLFDSEEHYTIAAKSMRDDMELMKAVRWIMDRETAIKNKLEQQMKSQRKGADITVRRLLQKR